MKEPSFSWNPPIRNTLMAVGKDDIDDKLDFDDKDDTSFCETDSQSGDITLTPVEEFLQVIGDRPRHDEDVCATCQCQHQLCRGLSPG